MREKSKHCGKNSGLGGSLSNGVGQAGERQKRHKVSKASKFVTLLTLLTPESKFIECSQS
jgi:hypothetical protein